jgi:outer membrane immunogenic protein
MSYKSVWGAAGIALASVVAVSVSAQAADLGERRHGGGYKDEPVYEAPAQWAGPYIGGHLGAVWSSGDVDVAWRGGTVNYDIGDSSVLGGVHLGYNWQRQGFVAGIEGDLGFADQLDYLASIRGRLGVAAGSFLIYGTGGVAFAGVDVSGTITDVAGTANYAVSGSEVGYVVGGGAEVKLAPNWSLGVEGLYYGFDGLAAQGAATAQTAAWDAQTGADFGVVRGRVSYHFGHGHEPLK